MREMKLSAKQKQTHRHREQTCGCQGGGRVGKGRIGSLGLTDGNYYIWNGYTSSYCIAQRTIFSML